MTAIKKMVCYSSQEEGARHTMPQRATQGSTRIGHEAEGARENVRKSPFFLCVCEEMGEAG